MKFAITALLMTLPLTACLGDRSKAQPPPVVSILPDVVAYQDAELDAGAREIRSGACPALSKVFMPDYLVMRDQTRASRDILMKRHPVR